MTAGDLSPTISKEERLLVARNHSKAAVPDSASQRPFSSWKWQKTLIRKQPFVTC
jgi:hypothetical protein